MEVARRWSTQSRTTDHEELASISITQFLDEKRNRLTPSSHNAPTFTRDDAEYALKIAARMESDFEGERPVPPQSRLTPTIGTTQHDSRLPKAAP